jgi:hypothetical protein
MFRQLVTAPNPADQLNNINSLFTYHPLQISAIVETVWQNRYNAASTQTSSPFLPWSPTVAHPLLTGRNFFSGYDWNSSPPTPIYPVYPVNFVPPLQQPGIKDTWDGLTATNNTRPTNWDHLIYAYIIENTRIFDIFAKVLDTYMFTEQLETPSAESQLFWRNLEYLIFGDAMPSMVWTATSRSRRDEIADRLTAYYWMFGIDLSHAPDIAAQHPYQKPAAANRDFIPTFEALAREVWRGIVNARNTSGANDTDATVIATLARRLYDMMATRRINGNLSREEFRAVSVISFLNLAVQYDSPAVVDLKASASSPEMRLQKIGERVQMNCHVKSKPFFDLAGPFSTLMQSIESGAFNTPAGAELLYKQTPANIVSRNAEEVIDQYSLATGRDLKSKPVLVTGHTSESAMHSTRRSPPIAAPIGAPVPRRLNGQSSVAH